MVICVLKSVLYQFLSPLESLISINSQLLNSKLEQPLFHLKNIGLNHLHCFVLISKLVDYLIFLAHWRGLASQTFNQKMVSQCSGTPKNQDNLLIYWSENSICGLSRLKLPKAMITCQAFYADIIGICNDPTTNIIIQILPCIIWNIIWTTWYSLVSSG